MHDRHRSVGSVPKLGYLLGGAAILFASAAMRQASANEAMTVTSGVAASCATEHRDAAVVRAEPADVPDLPGLQEATGTAYVQVDLAPTGALTRASIAKSTGNRILDLSALRAAQWTSF
jgi:TonB family protein